MNNMPQERFSSLDGLRTIAMLGIVAMHVNANMAVHPTKIILLSDILNYAGDFVLLFMMISAFSLCCGYLERFRNGSVSLETFYAKRYKRVLPFFALLTFIDVLFCCVGNRFAFNQTVAGELWEAFANLTLLFGLVPGNGISVIGVGWFLGVIFLFYLLFPFYTTLLSTKRNAWFAFAISIVWSIAIEKYFAPVKGSFSGNTCMLVTAPYFMTAGLVYIYRGTLKNLLPPRQYVFKVLVLLYSVLFFVFPNYRFAYSNLLMYTLWLIYAIIENPVKRSFLNNSVMAFMSGISMEIYLCHMMFFRVVEKVHLERYFTNENVLYFITLSFVLFAAIIFSLGWKKVEKKVVN